VRLPPLPRVRDLPWKEFFTNKAFLAIVMAHSAFGEWSEHPSWPHVQHWWVGCAEHAAASCR
jgi:hypothetical protein